MRSALFDAVIKLQPFAPIDALDAATAAILRDMEAIPTLDREVAHLLVGDEVGIGPATKSPIIAQRAADIAHAMRGNIFLARNVLAARFPDHALDWLRILHPQLVDPEVRAPLLQVA